MYYGNPLLGGFSTTSKVGGLTVQVEPNKDAPLLSKHGFDLTIRARSMQELYGSDTTGFAKSGFVWSAELIMNLVAPNANITGTYYKGAITMGQIPNVDDSNGLTIE